MKAAAQDLADKLPKAKEDINELVEKCCHHNDPLSDKDKQRCKSNKIDCEKYDDQNQLKVK